jgi:uncharacterized protein YjbI with pentapeptide repeats
MHQTPSAFRVLFTLGQQFVERKPAYVLGLAVVVALFMLSMIWNRNRQSAAEERRAAEERKEQDEIDKKQLLKEYFSGVESVLNMGAVMPENKAALISAKTANIWLYLNDIDRNSVVDYLGKMNFPGISFRGFGLNNLRFSGLSFPRADFDGALIFYTNFSNAKLEGATFRKSILVDASFDESDLRDANFEHARADKAQFGGAKLESAIFDNASLSGANFGSAQLDRARFISAHMEGARMRWARCLGADFREAHLERAFLGGAIFESADMRMVNMSDAWLGPGGNFPSIKGAYAVGRVTGDDEETKIYASEVFGVNAVFDFANLNNAIWPNGIKCKAGSVGGCNPD